MSTDRPSQGKYRGHKKEKQTILIINHLSNIPKHKYWFTYSY